MTKVGFESTTAVFEGATVTRTDYCAKEQNWKYTINFLFFFFLQFPFFRYIVNTEIAAALDSLQSQRHANDFYPELRSPLRHQIVVFLVLASRSLVAVYQILGEGSKPLVSSSCWQIPEARGAETSPPSVSPSSRKCWSFDASQNDRPPRPGNLTSDTKQRILMFQYLHYKHQGAAEHSGEEQIEGRLKMS